MRFTALFGFAFAMAQIGASPALAHARWFIDEPKVAPVFFTFGMLHVALAALTGIFLLVFWGIDRTAHRGASWHAVLNCKLRVPAGLEWRAMAIVFGAVLIINSMERVFLAPNLTGGGQAVLGVLLFLQIILGALLVMQTRMTEAALALLVLPFLGLAVFSVSGLVDYAFEIAAVGVSLYMVSPLMFERDKVLRRNLRRLLPERLSLCVAQRHGAPRTWTFSWPDFPAEFRGAAADRRERLAAEWLRVMLGGQLVVLAAHDKLFFPGISLAFVDMYPFVNFPALLGFPLTNLDFVYAAGLAETAFGVALMFNLAVRLISLAMLGLFTLTGVLFGVSEMLGHLPILAILGVIFAQGSGRGFVAQVETGTPVVTSRVSFAAAAAAAVGVAAIFVAEPGVTKAHARLDPAMPQRSSAAAAALALPDALFQRFRAEMLPLSRQPRAVQEKVAAIAAALDTASTINGPLKDEIASKFFELSVVYEAAVGRDAASLWLRYAHLTASCAPDEINETRRTLASGQWLTRVARMPWELQAMLMPVARAAAHAIAAGETTGREGGVWSLAAGKTAIGPADAEHMHTLAAIGRIADAASAASVGQPESP